MWIETETFSEPFCSAAEPNYFRDLLHRVSARSAYNLVIPPDRMTITGGNSNASEGFVVWKQGSFGEQTGMCISGDHAGSLVYKGPLHVRVGRMIAVDGAGFDAQRGITLVERHAIPESLRDTLITLLQDGGDGSLAIALTQLLAELDYPVDTTKFIANIFEEGLRYNPSEEI